MSKMLATKKGKNICKDLWKANDWSTQLCFSNLVSDLGRAAVKVPQLVFDLVLWLMAFVECLFHKSLRKFFSSLSEAGAPIPGMRNSSLHNQKWDILEWSLWWCREWNKILLPAGTSVRVVGKNKVSIKELEWKWIPRMIFCLQTHLITRVFRVLNIFLSTRQPILSPSVIWTLLCCSLQTFVPHTQGCTFLISWFLTLLQF